MPSGKTQAGGLLGTISALIYGVLLELLEDSEHWDEQFQQPMGSGGTSLIASHVSLDTCQSPEQICVCSDLQVTARDWQGGVALVIRTKPGLVSSCTMHSFAFMQSPNHTYLSYLFIP